MSGADDSSSGTFSPTNFLPSSPESPSRNTNPKRARTEGGKLPRRSRGGRGRANNRGNAQRGKRNSAPKKTQTRRYSSKKKQTQNEFLWNDNGRPYREFPFTGSSGVKLNVDDVDGEDMVYDPTCPLEIVKTFLSEKLMNDIVEHTNTYADIIKQLPHVQERMNQSERSLFTLWTDINVDELWVYLCLQIIMGLVNKPSLHSYWSKNHVLSTPVFSRLMRRDRFEQIRKMIHFTNPLEEDPSDSLSKLNSLLDNLREKFRTNYIPSQHVAVDEYLSLWKGRLKFRMYIPNERERYGVKIYMICESETGYLSNFIVYTGADTKYPRPTIPLPKGFDEYTNPSKVVLSLMEGFYNQGYNIALDNLYTSPELLKALFLNKTDAYGTLRKKEGLPQNFWEWKPVKGVGESAETKFCDETYIVLRWNDAYKTKSTKIVSMMSTKHTGVLQESGKIHHATKLPIKKPEVIVAYNKTMGGVDNLSRVLVPYALARKGIKWYRKLAELFIDFSIYNSFIIWKKLNSQSKLTNLQFRLQLVDAIIMHHLTEKGSNRPGPSGKDRDPLRLKERHFISHIPLSNNKRVRKKCVRCTSMEKRTDTSFQCAPCNVALCIEPCFQIYHTRKNFSFNDEPLSSETEEEIVKSESDSSDNI